MKTLLLTRHAKTIQAEGLMSDFDRHLTSRGHKDPLLIAREVLDLGIEPDKIVSSPAKRAIQTAEIFAGKFNIPVNNIKLADFLYGYFATEKLIEYLSSYASKSQCVQVVGHNPKMEELAADLTGSVYRRIPTSGTMVIEFEVNKWEYVSEGSGMLIHNITAKSLRD